MGGHGLKEDIEEIIGAVAADTGYMIYESAVYIKGANSRISVKIDRVHGISHTDCEMYSRELSRRLDASELLPNYLLEISSPGITRKLRNLDEFIRFRGLQAKVVYETEGKRTFCKGLICAVNGDTIEMRDGEQTMMIRFTDIVRANLEEKQ